MTIWGELPDGGRILRTKLEELGFAPVEGMTGVYGNGEPLVPDLVKASQSDPWRGRIGQASFIAFDNGTIIQAATPELLDTVRAADQSTGDLTFVVAALGGIDAVVAQGAVREAVLFSTAAGLQASPMADLLATTRSIEEVRETMEQRLDMPQPGVPPYLGGLLVAAEIAGTPAMVISLVYPDCMLANSAAEAMVTLWQTEQVGGTTLAERASGAVTPGSIAGTGLCSAILTIEGDAGEDARILPNLLFGALYQRDFPLLRTAMPCHD